MYVRLFFSYTAAHGPHGTGGGKGRAGAHPCQVASTLVIAAAIIVAVRLAREDITLPTPRLLSSVGHSVSLARTILKEVLRRYPGA